MLNNFLETLQGGLKEPLSGAGVDASRVGDVADVVTNTFKDGLTEKFTKGDIGSIMGLFGNNGANSSFASGMMNSVAANLISKIGLSKEISNTVAGIAVPYIVEKFSGFISDQGKNNEEGVKDLMGDLLKGSMKDQLLGGLGKKFGF